MEMVMVRTDRNDELGFVRYLDLCNPHVMLGFF